MSGGKETGTEDMISGVRKREGRKKTGYKCERKIDIEIDEYTQ